ncbi:14446_t:CDS:2 [Acaulospora morrowiae]|uniref:14446_t:CDS:1 n=1 Tax=Acaulospora morrowiae TaxID=94023 RepID=A0A9N8V719_9GLOM|nr:14446_t:CDS:2 [Acaulospora morrowiae]
MYETINKNLLSDNNLIIFILEITSVWTLSLLISIHTESLNRLILS